MTYEHSVKNIELLSMNQTKTTSFGESDKIRQMWTASSHQDQSSPLNHLSPQIFLAFQINELLKERERPGENKKEEK